MGICSPSPSPLTRPPPRPRWRAMTNPASASQGHRAGGTVGEGRTSPMMRTRNTSTGSSRPFTTRRPMGSASIPARGDRGRGRHDLAAVGLGLQSLGHVHGVADHRVFEAAAPADRAGDHDPVFTPDPDVESIDGVGPQPSALSSPCRAASRARSRQRASAWSSMGSGAPKIAITASPWNLSIVPPCSVDDLGHRAEVTADDLGDSPGAEPLGQGREPPDVAEQHGHLELALLHDPRASRSATWGGTKDDSVSAAACWRPPRHAAASSRRRGRGPPSSLPAIRREQAGDAEVDGLLGGAERAGHLPRTRGPASSCPGAARSSSSAWRLPSDARRSRGRPRSRPALTSRIARTSSSPCAIRSFSR